MQFVAQPVRAVQTLMTEPIKRGHHPRLGIRYPNIEKRGKLVLTRTFLRQTAKRFKRIWIDRVHQFKTDTPLRFGRQRCHCLGALFFRSMREPSPGNQGFNVGPNGVVCKDGNERGHHT